MINSFCNYLFESIIVESMLSYSRRMSEVNQKRGFLTKEEERMELPLLIKATHLSHPNYSRPR